MSVNMLIKDFKDHGQYGYRSVVTWIRFASAFVNWKKTWLFSFSQGISCEYNFVYEGSYAWG